METKGILPTPKIEVITKWVFLGLFALYVIATSLGTSSMDYDLPQWWFEKIEACLVGLIIVKCTTEPHTAKAKLILCALTLTFCYIAKLYNYDGNIVIVALFVLAAENVDFKEILTVYLIVKVGAILLAVITSQTGISIDYMRVRAGFLRHSFGICNTTDFMAHILFAFLAYFFLRGLKITYLELVASGASSLWLFHKTYARANTICILFAIVAIALFKFLSYKQIKVVDWKIWKLAPALMPGLAALMIGLCAAYSKDNPFFQKVNQILSLRISLGSQGLHDYGIKLIGQPIYERGFGYGAAGAIWGPYFFLDSSYMRIFIIDGLVLLLAILALYVCIARQMVVQKYSVGLVAIFAISLACFEEHHLLELCYNPFTLLLLSKFKSEERIPVVQAAGMKKTVRPSPSIKRIGSYAIFAIIALGVLVKVADLHTDGSTVQSRVYRICTQSQDQIAVIDDAGVVEWQSPQDGENVSYFFLDYIGEGRYCIYAGDQLMSVRDGQVVMINCEPEESANHSWIIERIGNTQYIKMTFSDTELSLHWTDLGQIELGEYQEGDASYGLSLI